MSETPEEHTARLIARLDAPTELDRIETTYSLVFRKVQGKAGYDWRVEVPYWMTQQQGREVALTLRDAVRALGFDVEVVQVAKVTDVIA